MIQRLVAIGRLTPSQRPDAEALRGWLAQDRHIAAVTGWQPGTFNYREAMMQPIAQGDQPPAPPSPERIAALRDQLKRLQDDEWLTTRLRQNAYRQWSDSPEGEQSPYTVDARTRHQHYCHETARIGALISQVRAELDAAASLRTLQ